MKHVGVILKYILCKNFRLLNLYNFKLILIVNIVLQFLNLHSNYIIYMIILKYLVEMEQDISKKIIFT